MTLSEYRKCFNLSLEEFIARYEIKESQIEDNVEYQKIEGVTRIEVLENEYFFFQGEKLKIVYISDEQIAQNTWVAFKASTKADASEKTVRSRAGKTSNQEIFASKGFAASIKRDEVDFVEVFEPCSLREYLENVYEEVGKFIR